MFGILASSVVCVMLHGCLCTQWSIQMTENITAVSGSCIVVPCSFTVSPEYDTELHNTSVALWSRGVVGGPAVLKTDQTVAAGFKGKILGDIKSKNCTTVFTELPQGFKEALLFRVEGPANLKYTYPKELFISFQTGSAPQPVLSVSPRGEVRAGSTLTLKCRAIAPCPSLPPEVRLWPQMDGSNSSPQVYSEQGVMFVTVTESFTVTPNHYGLNVTCEVEYPRRNGRESHREAQSMTLNILYGPHNTRVLMSFPSPVPVGRLLNLSCLSEANPPVTSYNWYTVSGDQLVLRATGQELFLMTSWADRGLYVCEAISPNGQERSAILALEVETEGPQCSMVPYVLCGVLACLYVITLLVEIYKYKRSHSQPLYTFIVNILIMKMQPFLGVVGRGGVMRVGSIFVRIINATIVLWFHTV
ncbi:hypothetical protein ACEWY4_022987 [Coilia grayii]|uniref:Ig-like domain-containing protein n=1 Tax=Coilia grayii TaxID=363190 RepID=A0ABD1J1T4_9TELE